MWIGLRPAVAQKVQPLAQFLAAFPANVLFPFVVIAIVATNASPKARTERPLPPAFRPAFDPPAQPVQVAPEPQAAGNSTAP